jgi:sporulation protein YlmC with PRC-barrel domain
MNKRIDQYIAEYEEREGLDSDENDQNTDDELIKEMKALMIEFSSFSLFEKDNAETFTIIFESIKNLESMIIDLINRSFSHYLIDFHTNMNDQSSSNDQIIDHLQISLKNGSSIIVHTDMKDINFDSFAYVMISDRYISEKFYEMMIDSSASTKSTVKYDQYLVFKKHKIDSSIDLNVTKTETVNIQFDIGSARSIESLIIDTSFEIVKFHVIKTDTSFLLSLADMDRLKVYFNNVENILNMIIQNRKLSIIRRFDHGFLL